MAAPRTILHVFSTFAVGGPQRRFATVSRAHDGYRHLIAAMDDNHAAAELLDDADHELVTLSMAKGRSLDIQNLLRLRRLLKEKKPDLLCTYNWGSIEAVIANRLSLKGQIVPHIHFEDGFGPDESQHVQLPRRVAMRRLFLKNSRVIVPSRTLEKIAADVWGLRNVTFVPNGIDTALFYPVGAKPDATFTIGTVGALRPEKNFALLIKAFADSGLAGRARLIIAGDGSTLSQLTDIADKLGIAASVDFPGHIADPAELYRSFDVFAISSNTEQMPLSLLEAMASGLPVIATDVGDIATMLSYDNNPLVVPSGDMDGLASAMRQCFEDATLRQRIGVANRAKVLRDYQLQQMIDAYGNLFSGSEVA
ncbi:glycosyltransferase family 4 protein [Parvularcula flava]|uniref:Glycosyl transferase family 1 n=1 Tax=Aquisalinus luteolus TaxID=1566827 RepID=A0A8J3A1B4_9PROT|nr:glycosyltransferase family 4 protein [Aquisalinus luteolus]NHK27500.1 glycosyltransferase family 4 protein [Aquisalinus luteolus]GGH95625.1 glycosyl transferase family 1 [Aquisalinus luteolus]